MSDPKGHVLTECARECVSFGESHEPPQPHIAQRLALGDYEQWFIPCRMAPPTPTLISSEFGRQTRCMFCGVLVVYPDSPTSPPAPPPDR